MSTLELTKECFWSFFVGMLFAHDKSWPSIMLTGQIENESQDESPSARIKLFSINQIPEFIRGEEWLYVCGIILKSS
jgi:hypothetical protein